MKLMLEKLATHAVVSGEHFYQPPRRASHNRLLEFDTDPQHINWNRIIAKECYVPQLSHGTLALSSFDFYATMRAELGQIAPEEIVHLQEAMRLRGVGDPFLHVLLPDLDDRDKRLLLMAGRSQFQQEAGVTPRWLWVPETALDLASLVAAKQAGYEGVLCAPEQIYTSDQADNHPIKVRLPDGSEILLLPFDRPFSSSLAFDRKLNADEYAQQVILPRLMNLPMSRPIISWTDGETFGHHSKGGDRFLDYLLKTTLPNLGIAVLGINELTEVWEPSDYLPGQLRDRTAWSCPHGNLTRWHGACPCDGGFHGGWKGPFSSALQHLNQEVTAQLDNELSADWPELLSQNFATAFYHSGSQNSELSLYAAKAAALAAQTSCGTFFDSPQTSGRINLLFARQALEHLRDAQLGPVAAQLQQNLCAELATGRDPHTGLPLDQLFQDLI